MTPIKTMLAILALGAAPALAEPDFTGPEAKAKPLAASAEATKPILPEDDIAFANNSAALRDTGLQQIKSVVRYLKANRSVKIIVEGHANSAGTAIHNEDLATRRADLVRMHLIGNGIASDRIIVVVYGETGAKPAPSPIDRRVVLSATVEAPQTISRRLMQNQAALSVTWTSGTESKNPVLITETHGTVTEQVATR